MKLIYSALYADDCHPFNALCDKVDYAKNPDDLKEHDSALVIWGGSDIHPGYYNHPMHRTTHPGGLRDRLEWSLMQRAIELGIPIFGVCRGAQMLCAAAGGYLIQDVKNHVGHHTVHTAEGSFEVNSIHHQMMCWEGTKVEAELLAWSPVRLSINTDRTPYYGYRDNEQFVPPEGWQEPEFVYFPKIHGYAIQWHPEGMRSESEATKFILKTINEKESARGDFAATTVSLN